MARNIISCRPMSYGKYQDKAYEHMAKIGIRYVELPMPEPQDIGNIRKELDKHGLSLASLEAPCNLQSKNVSEEFKLPIKVAEELNAKRIFVSVHAGELTKKTAYEKLRGLGNLAAAKGLIVVLETHPDLVTNGDVALKTIKSVDHPNVRINFDTANIYYYNEGVDGVEEMKKILDYIEGVHLKDTNGKPRTWHFPALGEGIVNFSKVRELLNNRSFYGPFTIEIEGIEGESLTLEQTLERMEKSVKHLRKCGF
jgi:sugar phosphate isomerase/epimerase